MKITRHKTIPFQIANPIINDGAALNKRMNSDGYLFFQGLLDQDSILEVRRSITRLCAEAGWISPDSDPMEATAAPDVKWVEPQPEFMAVYNKVMRLECFHVLAHQPAISKVVEQITQDQVLVHPRNIARIIFPNNEKYTTPAHQDYIHIQGTEQTYTAWIPLGECPQSLGSLAILAGSHRLGLLPTHFAYGAGACGIDTDALDLLWVCGDFHLGDFVLFHSLTVHKGLLNRSPNQIRLSVDYRYQGIGQPVTKDSLLPHFAQLTWEEIYREWRNTKHQYYWTKFPLHLVEFSPKFVQEHDVQESRITSE